MDFGVGCRLFYLQGTPTTSTTKISFQHHAFFFTNHYWGADSKIIFTMKKLFTFLLYAMMIIAVGCTESFDDSKIWDKLNSLENRVEALEQLCRQMNTNISSLQTVVNALQNNDYVTNIAPITEDGKVIGYTITFSKSGAVTIYHGKDGKDGANGANGADGKDGYTPVIGVAKDSDGVYYWTLDGDWLLDKDGNKVKAEGVDGKDGQNGANGQDGKNGTTPKLKIENDNWYISYDNGATWTELGKATGENGADGKDGDSMFTDVSYDDYFVSLTLIDGSVIVIPLHTIHNNEIWYTSSDGKILIPSNADAFGATIVSNEYKNGMGVITFDGNITTIGFYAFYNSNLESITIPESIISIGEAAFAFCSNLKGITIPDGITSIEFMAFFRCSNLKNITIPESVTSIGDLAFANCKSIESITIPQNVTTISEGTFHGCQSLAAFYGKFASSDNLCLIVNGVLNAFAPVANTTSYTIPDGVTSIGDSAFANCQNLENITISESVTSIGDDAFANCDNLKNVFCKATTPPTCGAEPFVECTSLAKIYVPTASVDAYKAATNWSFYTDLIEGYNF